MYIPREWSKASGDCQTPDGRRFPVSIWGWGDDPATAKREAAKRLQKMLEKIGRGDPWPDRYAYGNRPLREEILQVFESETPGQPAAILSRNGYGAQVLNTAQLLFLDIDLRPPTFLQRILSNIGLGPDLSEAAVMVKLREVLKRYSRATFRIYRTAAGLRVMAVDRDFDPVGREAKELMEATGTDPAFAKLCAVQKSFRARLTPKPWRCNCPRPTVEYPQPDNEARRRFEDWLSGYERASGSWATCLYLETVGTGRPGRTAGRLVDLHDRMTRCDQPLPLA